MSYTVNFSATQALGILSQITLTDISTGTPPTLTTRKVTVAMADGTLLADAEDWPLADTTKAFDILSRSVAVNITVQWMNGTTVVDQKTILYCFDLYDYIFAYSLTQQQTSAPTLVNDTVYWMNKAQFMVNLKDAENAVTYGGDIYSAQNSLNLNYNMIQNSDKYF